MHMLVFGGSGQVGRALRETAPVGAVVEAPPSCDIDLCSEEAMQRAIAESAATVVVNCAAFTRVDDAEEERERCTLINATAPAVMATSCVVHSRRLIQLSTDYVFDGSATRPYRPEDATSPINHYGATKRDGELAVLRAGSGVIVRTAWVHAPIGTNFVRTAVSILSQGRVMSVVDDQIGTPTRATNLAAALWRLAASDLSTGILHYTDAGCASWYDVAVAVKETMATRHRLPPGAAVIPIPSSMAPRRAARPLFSVLDKHGSWEATGTTPIHWREGVRHTTEAILDA